ncbi:hypothetical protein JMJ77_0003368 [Colletotrichum scovillei]|uniref:Uncharacterized protein n=2 Tax=Colletotrichum scovillei TaxID=1209932 RepID=A0A9P7U433_9PEZI|nr:hypothetical protein JMJ78_0004880 [Colletotrichum scovillei]KAG7041261.1 hypothetical protein JMJ77_0003368 [Colletotrichum scovillei]KAG7061292.1 hypothetical protein JMJ76_0000857 [Colletotrichum scovillei]
MVDQEIHGRWYRIAGKLLNRGLIGDILGTPGAIVSQVLSSPATTTQGNVQAEGTPAAAATTQAAAAPAATTAAASPVAATTPAAQQPAASPAATTKQDQQQAATTSVAQAPAAAATTSQQAAQASSTTVAAASPPAASSSSSSATAATSSTPAAAATTVPVAAENAASSPVLSQTVTPEATGTSVTGVGAGGASSTRSGVTNATQTPSPNYENTSSSSSQGPLVATGVVLGIVVLMGLSLLIFWCYRRRRKAARHLHEAVALESPSNEYGPASPFRDHVDQSFTEMTDNRTVSNEDEFTIQHPEPGYQPPSQPPMSPQMQDTPRTNPYAASPFSYAQAQQYVQSLAGTGTFGFPPPPPIPEPSPIRIFRWPTRSSRSGNSTPSVFSGFRTPKTPTRALSRASRSTVSSMLWHGRRDVARRTIIRTPGSQKSAKSARSRTNISSHSPESTMPEGLHTPILDWLHWIRGHQQVEPDPEMNHRKSFASTTESSISETSVASTASSGVFSPTLLSYHPPANTPSVTTETIQYLPLPLFKKRASDSNSEVTVEASGTVRIPSFG